MKGKAVENRNKERKSLNSLHFFLTDYILENKKHNNNNTVRFHK